MESSLALFGQSNMIILQSFIIKYIFMRIRLSTFYLQYVGLQSLNINSQVEINRIHRYLKWRQYGKQQQPFNNQVNMKWIEAVIHTKMQFHNLKTHPLVFTQNTGHKLHILNCALSSEVWKYSLELIEFTSNSSWLAPTKQSFSVLSTWK